MSDAPQPQCYGLQISLTTARIEPLVRFYCEAFGCRELERDTRRGVAFETLMQVQQGAQRRLLSLGEERIELLQFDAPGEPYPSGAQASDLSFQHFAIVVSDMQRAYEHLMRTPGWTPISSAGPVRLPLSSGGVEAFKFRDPEGHPLELLSFPADRMPSAWRQKGPHAAGCLGIDHSAISVADSAASLSFYQGLGLAVAGRTINRGDEQARLDGLVAPEVEVTALELPRGGMHLELLCYRGVARARPRRWHHNDVAATRLVFEMRPQPHQPRSLRDPDGHWLVWT